MMTGTHWGAAVLSVGRKNFDGVGGAQSEQEARCEQAFVWVRARMA